MRTGRLSLFLLLGLLLSGLLGWGGADIQVSAQENREPLYGNYDVLHIKFDSVKEREAFQRDLGDYAKHGIHVYDAFQEFADVFVYSQHLDGQRFAEVTAKIRKAKGWWEEGGRVSVPPPPSITLAKGKPRSEPEKIFRGHPKLKGKGVVIVIVDTGIDFHHEDFVRTGPDGKKTSQVAYFWDASRQPLAAGPGSSVKSKYRYPDGQPVGTIYTREELTAELGLLPGSKLRIPYGDIDGHGTACAGIAAGQGNVNRDFIGLAPDADLIAVRIGSDRLPFAFLLPAICGWVDEIAAGRPVVISCSFGGKYGGRDGMRVEQLQLNARFPLSRPRALLCIAAGNDGDRRLHAEFSLPPNGKQVLQWKSPKAIEEGVQLTLRSNADSPDDIQVTGKVKVYKQQINKLTGQFEAELYGRSNDEVNEATISNRGNKDVLVDAYLDGDGRAEFLGQWAAYTKQIQTPGTALNAITIGSYDWNDLFPGEQNAMKVYNGTDEVEMKVGELSAYSNPGPRRLAAKGESPKPDIVAPGQYFVCAASQVIPKDWVRRTADGKYRNFNGTSAATPYAAGVLALLLEAKPSLTVGEVKNLLKEHATRTKEMDKQNHYWGNGKLDRGAVDRLIEAVGK